MGPGDLINWTALSFVMSALSMAGSGGAWIYVHLSKRHAATDAQVKRLDNRLTAVETAIKALPTGESWGQMREDIAGIRGDVRASAAEIRGLGAGLKRVENQIGLLMENELRGKTEVR